MISAAEIDAVIRERIRPYVTEPGHVVIIRDVAENMTFWRERIIASVSGVATRMHRTNGHELHVRMRIGPDEFIQRSQWFNGVARWFSGSETDGRRLCEVWNAEAESRGEQHRFRVCKTLINCQWVWRGVDPVAVTATVQSVRILRHEKHYVSEVHDLTKSRGDIRRKIWSLAVGEDCIVNCDRKTAYKLTEAERLRHRDRTRRFRFKTVQTENGPQVRVLRMVDSALYDIASWRVDECRDFHGHSRNRWYLMGRLNREFAKGKPNAQIFETISYTETTFTIKRVR